MEDTFRVGVMEVDVAVVFVVVSVVRNVGGVAVAVAVVVVFFDDVVVIVVDVGSKDDANDDATNVLLFVLLLVGVSQRILLLEAVWFAAGLVDVDENDDDVVVDGNTDGPDDII